MIDLRHFRQFIAVTEAPNFRRAAERLHIDQTPLSRTGHDLGEQLGVRLFVPVPRKLHLAPAGHRLLKDSRKVLIRIQRTQRVERETDTRFHAQLRVGVANGIAQPKLSQCLLNWRRVAPEIQIELAEMRASELADALRREERDAGYSFGLPDDVAGEQQPAWRYAALALLPLEHESALRSELGLTKLLSFPVLSYHVGRQTGLNDAALAALDLTSIRRHAEDLLMFHRARDFVSAT